MDCWIESVTREGGVHSRQKSVRNVEVIDAGGGYPASEVFSLCGADRVVISGFEENLKVCLRNAVHQIKIVFVGTIPEPSYDLW